MAVYSDWLRDVSSTRMTTLPSNRSPGMRRISMTAPQQYVPGFAE
jgi:hypothetical protein